MNENFEPFVPTHKQYQVVYAFGFILCVIFTIGLVFAFAGSLGQYMDGKLPMSNAVVWGGLMIVFIITDVKMVQYWPLRDNSKPAGHVACGEDDLGRQDKWVDDTTPPFGPNW